jgi:hypothetical protein
VTDAAVWVWTAIAYRSSMMIARYAYLLSTSLQTPFRVDASLAHSHQVFPPLVTEGYANAVDVIPVIGVGLAFPIPDAQVDGDGFRREVSILMQMMSLNGRP